MSALQCPADVVAQTLAHLRTAGRLRKECVVFWLCARPVTSGACILEAYLPEQLAAEDVFRIPATGMTALMAHLRAGKLALAAQVHSHPGRAFHSEADDQWAVVRHEGALSLVVPDFAERASADNFLDVIAAFSLAATDRWVAIDRQDLPAYLELIGR